MLIHYEASVASARHEIQGCGNREHCCVQVVEPPRAFGAAGDGDTDGGGSATDARLARRSLPLSRAVCHP